MRNQLNSFFRMQLLSVALLFSLTLLFSPASAQVDSREKDFNFIEGLRLLNLGNIDAAEKVFAGLLEKNPLMDASHYYLSSIYIKKGDLKKAEKSTAEAVKLDPDNYWYKIQLARIYSATNQLDKATEVYEDIRRSNPARSDLYIDMIDLYTRRQDYPKALAILDDIERVSGKNEATGLTRYNILIGQQKQPEAIEFLKEFAKEHSSPRIATVLGDYFASIQKDTLAMTYYSTALSMDPKYIPATFGIAEGYRVRGQYDLYFEYMFPFMSNTEVNPRLKADYMKEILANPKFVQTFYPQVDTMMQNLYGAHPQDSLVAYGFAVFMVQTSRADIGLKVLEKNIGNYPNEREPMHQLLSLIYYLERWENLIAQSDTALLKFPGDLDFIQLKGIGQLQLNQTDSAINTFLSILPLAKGDSATTVRTLSILGDTYYMAGNKKEAYKYYQKTIRLEPNHAAALNNYAYYLSEEGKQLKKAKQMSKKTIELEPENATYLDTYAWILHKLGQNVEAKAILKQAMVYGGNENADILDHYAEVLFALGEKDLAFMYWGQADKLDPSLGIAQKAEKLKKK
ncbi:MAG: hypothetical protein CVT93_04415 [Bacteroidetes bacterium HGW-Bacteroidetes-10]|nr:MAG: hypothetical protein CVT93_04415 [Bacteroidetes bacterium HGW-Bacteroidetes-10]